MIIWRQYRPQLLSARRVAARIPRYFTVFGPFFVCFCRLQVQSLSQSVDAYTSFSPGALAHMIGDFMECFGAPIIELGRVGGDGVRIDGCRKTMKSNV